MLDCLLFLKEDYKLGKLLAILIKEQYLLLRKTRKAGEDIYLKKSVWSYQRVIWGQGQEGQGQEGSSILLRSGVQSDGPDT